MGAYNIPVVTSAMDAVRAFVALEPVGFPDTVAETLTGWGFTIAPAASLDALPAITAERAAMAADILSDVDRDHAINAADPIAVESDDQPDVIVPDLTVFVVGPAVGIPGDGALIVVARLNPDGTAAYTHPHHVPPPDPATFPPSDTLPPGAVGLAGFGQVESMTPPTTALIAALPLPTALATQTDLQVAAGHMIAFTGTMAGQILGKLPLIGGALSLAESGAQVVQSEGGAHQIVQLLVDTVQGAGGVVGMALRVAIPGLATLQIVADIVKGDPRSLVQAAATLLTAPLAVLFGPVGAAAQGAARWLAGKGYDWYAEREATAAANAGLLEGQALMAGDPIGQQVLAYQYAQEQAVLRGLTTGGQVAAMQALTAEVLGAAPPPTQQAQEIAAYASEVAAYTGVMPDPAVIADALGQDTATVAAAMGLVPLAVQPSVELSLGLMEVPVMPEPAPEPVMWSEPAPEPVMWSEPLPAPLPEPLPAPLPPPVEVTDITGQPVLPSVEPVPLPPPPPPVDSRTVYSTYITVGAWPGMMGSLSSCAAYLAARGHVGGCRAVNPTTGGYLADMLTSAELTALGY